MVKINSPKSLTTIVSAAIVFASVLFLTSPIEEKSSIPINQLDEIKRIYQTDPNTSTELKNIRYDSKALQKIDYST